MRIVNLASGSKGNCTFVSFGKTKILIDVGLNDKVLCELLKKIDEDIKNISAVFVTHEHSDHIKGLKALAKKYDMNFYIHKKLVESGALADVVFKEEKLIAFENEKINVGDFQVQPFEISHDAVYPVGFVVNVAGSSARVGFVTDLGFVSEKIKKLLTGVKMIFLESNHDEQMLVNGKYPYMLKKRIASEKGHLSNAQALELAKYLYKTGTKCFVLSHISQHNNTYDLAYNNFVDYFNENNITLEKDVFVRVSFQNKRGNNFNLKEEYNGF